MKHLGMMPTARLNDRQVHPIQFHRWSDAQRCFGRPGKDRNKVEKLKESIRKEGIREPILLGVSDRYPDVYVGDGHHRAVALMELGVAEFPFHWYWIRAFGVHMESEPFPYHHVGF